MSDEKLPFKAEEGSLPNSALDRIRTLAKRQGVAESELPEPMRDAVILRSKKGEIGQIHVRRFTGVVKNGAYKLLLDLEKKRGKEDIIAALELSGSKQAMAIVELYRSPRKRAASIARLVAEANVSPDVVFTQYSAGKVKLLKAQSDLDAAQAIADASEGMPKVVRDLLRVPLTSKLICRTCFGKKFITAKVNEREETLPCPMCNAEGVTLEVSKSQMDVIRELKEIAGLKQAGMNIVNQQGVVVKGANGGGGGSGQAPVDFLGSVHEQRDKLLALPAPSASDEVEAEVVDARPSGEAV